MKNYLTTILKHLLTVIIGSLICVIALAFVYLLPNSPIRQNASASVNTLKDFGVNPTQVHGYTGTTQDTYTDAWMLRIAAYDGPENIFQKGLSGYFWGYPDEEYSGETISALEAYANNAANPQRYSYGRYWHGYLIFLRPLLLIFDYADIIQLMHLWVISLIIFLSIALYKNGLSKLIPVFVAVLSLINYSTIASSIQYISIFSIAVIGSLAILKLGKKEDVNLTSFSYCFLIIGMCTSFFDFLTYPIFTLGFCMVILLSIESIRSRLFSRRFGAALSVIKYSVSWGVGYFVLWGLKWIYATVLTDTDVIGEAIIAIRERASTEAVEANASLNPVNVIVANISVWLKWQYIVVILLVTIYAVAYIIIRKRQIRSQGTIPADNTQDIPTLCRIDIIIAYLLCAIMPFAWFVISQNHSYLHNWMVYRIMSVSVWAFFAMLLSCYSLFSTRKSPI